LIILALCTIKARQRVIAAQHNRRVTSAKIAELVGIVLLRMYLIINIKRGFKMTMLEYASIAVLLLGCAGVIMIFKPWDLD
jgi:uncharacterized membrane protein